MHKPASFLWLELLSDLILRIAELTAQDGDQVHFSCDYQPPLLIPDIFTEYEMNTILRG